MKPKFFILIPALTPHGPVKGAVALANLISQKFSVYLAVLKPGMGVHSNISNQITIIQLSSEISWKKKHQNLILSMSKNRNENIIISSCLSADLFALSLKSKAFIFSSIRANNFNNYYQSYGIIGIIVAYFHYLSLRFFDRVYAMDIIMANQILKFSGVHASVIGNFIDETQANNYRSYFLPRNSIHLVFVGSLIERKQPLVLVNAVSKLISLGVDIRCSIIGDGPLKPQLQGSIEKLNLSGLVELMGFHDNPLPLVSASDIFVLPSLSEGTPRAALEALFLGLPCVLRNVDGNSQLITPGVNGELFDSDDQLVDAIKRAIKIFQGLKLNHGEKPSLLPLSNRESLAVDLLINDVFKTVGT